MIRGARQRQQRSLGREIRRRFRGWSVPVGLDWKLQNFRAVLAQRLQTSEIRTVLGVRRRCNFQ